jgi:hypothetical protein
MSVQGHNVLLPMQPGMVTLPSCSVHGPLPHTGAAPAQPNTTPLMLPDEAESSACYPVPSHPRHTPVITSLFWSSCPATCSVVVLFGHRWSAHLLLHPVEAVAVLLLALLYEMAEVAESSGNCPVR